MKVFIDKDPKANFYEKSDENHLINRRNFLGQTPLYMGAKHGNLQVVVFLLK